MRRMFLVCFEVIREDLILVHCTNNKCCKNCGVWGEGGGKIGAICVRVREKSDPNRFAAKLVASLLASFIVFLFITLVAETPRFREDSFNYPFPARRYKFYLVVPLPRGVFESGLWLPLRQGLRTASR